MMRSLSSREKMSQPRSPRWVCSMTVGMMKLPMEGGGASWAPMRKGSRSLMVFSVSSFASGFGCRRFGLGLVGGDDQAVWIFVGDLSLADQLIKRLLFDDLIAYLMDAVILLQLG